MSQSHNQSLVKHLDELSFDDLYVEIPEQTYEEIRRTIGNQLAKLNLSKLFHHSWRHADTGVVKKRHGLHFAVRH